MKIEPIEKFFIVILILAAFIGFLLNTRQEMAEDREDAFDRGYREGYSLGYDEGYSDGRDDGWYNGQSEGYAEGYDEGYASGHYDGYDSGYYDSSSDSNLCSDNNG